MRLKRRTPQKALVYADSDISKLEPLYIVRDKNDDMLLMRVRHFGEDEVVANLTDEFDPLTQDPDEYFNEVLRMQSLYEERRRDYGILYYKAYEALLLGVDGDGNGYRVKNDACGNIGSGKYPQDQFHRSAKKVRVVLGGNQAGKTQTGAAEAIYLSLGNHPYHKIRPNNKGRIVGQDLSKGIAEVIWPKYESLMPRSELKEEPKKYSGGETKKLSYKCGSSVEFLSYEQGVKMFEGWTGDWVWFDEPPPRDIFVACYRGLMRYGGIIFITGTPLSEAWIYDELFLKAGPGAEQPDVFSLPTRANPYLSDDEVSSYAATVPEDERPARLDGVFKHLSGLVYKEFGMVHRIPAFKIPSDWTRYMVMDFHQREPCAILWAAVNPKGILYFYDELKIDKSVFDISEAVKLKEKEEYGRPVPTRWIDSIAATPDRTTGQSALKEFRLAGEKLGWQMSFRSSTKNHSAGFKAVHGYLQLKNGLPGAYFLEGRVPNAIASMQHFQWDDFNGIKEKTKANHHAHFADDIRYICVMQPTYKRFQSEQEETVARKEAGVTGYRGG